jgi:hypothetical protein
MMISGSTLYHKTGFQFSHLSFIIRERRSDMGLLSSHLPVQISIIRLLYIGRCHSVIRTMNYLSLRPPLLR